MASKNFFKGICLVFSLFLLLTACQKQIDTPFEEPVSNETFIAEAKAWFANGPVQTEKKILNLPLSVLPQMASQRLFARMGKMQKKLEWENAVFYNQEDLAYLVVPVTTKLKKYGNDYDLAKSVVFYKKQGDEMKMNVVEVLSKKGTSLQNKATETIATAFFNTIRHKNETVSGINADVFFYNENYTALSNYQFNNGNFIPYSGKVQNKRMDGESQCENSSLIETELCQVWNVYLNTYDEWGVLISQVFLFSYEVGNCGGDPNEDQLPEGEGGSVGIYDNVVNLMQDPCKTAALNAITSININNTISNFYNSSILPANSPVDVVFVERDLQGLGETTPISGSNIYEIALSNNYIYGSQFMSQEAWGSVIAHEILHIFIYSAGVYNAINTNYAHHITIFSNLINTTSNLLQSSFGIGSDVATKLALNGLADLWSFGNFDSLSMSIYGYNLAQIQNTFFLYSVGGDGTRCN